MCCFLCYTSDDVQQKISMEYYYYSTNSWYLKFYLYYWIIQLRLYLIHDIDLQLFFINLYRTVSEI